jgi:excinuclease ABC subunit C
MKNASGKVIYVGKAVNLRNRVKSYFMKTDHDPKTEQMVANVTDFEFYIVASEEEALILELNLVKKFRPHFNIRLKDDKGFPYLKIDLDEEWPRVQVVRHVASDGARYFGPFANLHSIHHALDVVKSIFPFRSCEIKLDGHIRRPCLEYDMHHCVAPCAGKITRSEYMEIIHELILFLEGRQRPLERHLREQMRLAAELQQYEKAAWIRDQIRAVEQVIEWQKMAAKVRGDQDVIAFAPDKDQALVQLFFVRGGKLIGREAFTLQGVGGEQPERIMTDFVQKWLSSRRGKPVVLRVPERGPSSALLHTVEENAVKGVEQLRIKNLAQPSALEAALAELKEKLGLECPPERIEGYDISNIQGHMAVGSMVVFEEGKSVPARYRRFRIKGVLQANDYAMLQEVLRRRFSHIQGQKNGEGWSLPDLVLIDGGKGQVSAAREAMEETGAQAIPTLGLAKEKEEIFLPGRPEPISLPVTSPGLQLLQRVRDEAHRFALGYHQNIRKKEALTSVLDDIPGIGPHRKRTLLKHFGTFQNIRQASVDELTKVSGITPLIAQKIKEFVG